MSLLEIHVFEEPENTDWDNDGLTETQEKIYGTDPHLWDTDGDGLSDSEEVLGMANVGYEVRKFNSDPVVWDTDGDGLSDGWEVKFNPYSDPNKDNPKESDTDKDGLSDYDERYNYGTDPFHNDTDRDGLNDIDEVNKAIRMGEVNVFWDADPLDAYSNDKSVYNNKTEQWESLIDGQAARCMPYGETACLIEDTDTVGYPPSSFTSFNREDVENALKRVRPQTPSPVSTEVPSPIVTTEPSIQLKPEWCDLLGPLSNWVPVCK